MVLVKLGWPEARGLELPGSSSGGLTSQLGREQFPAESLEVTEAVLDHSADDNWIEPPYLDKNVRAYTLLAVRLLTARSPMARIYVETTIPSFYFDVRPAVEMVARRNWTRRWFDAALKSSDELVTSLAVEAELCNGHYPSRPEAMNLIAGLPLLDLDEAVAEVVDAYLYHQLMPKDPAGDALHLAAASYHRCDFLVTWNCEHLANANKFGHIRRINTMLGIGCPVLVTPLELLDEETNDE